MRNPFASVSTSRRERAQADCCTARPASRAETVKRLRKASELAQGFCLTFFIILLGGVLLAAFAQVGHAVKMTDGEWGDRATLVERLYVDEPGRVSNIVAIPFGSVPYMAGGWQRVDGLAVTETALLPYLVQLLSIGCLELAMLFLGARFFGRIAKSGEAFRRERARELGLIAKLAIVLSFAPGVLVWTTLKVGTLLLPEWPVAYEGNLFSYGLVVCGCLLFAFAKVFEYGCILQEQDDELV